jgi:peptidylprolyl isomerase
MTLVSSIVGTLVLIGVLVLIFVVVDGSDNGKKPSAAGKSTTPSASPSPSASTSTAPAPLPTKACTPEKGATVKYASLTITGATDLKKAPVVSGHASSDATTLSCADLVVGKGAVATAATPVTVEYVGIVYETGKVFQSSWTSAAATFSVAPGQVIDGFSQGIAGAGRVAPMRAGGRRVIVIPAALAYGATPPSGSNIPANASLVFVVDLQKVGAPTTSSAS